MKKFLALLLVLSVALMGFAVLAEEEIEKPIEAQTAEEGAGDSSGDDSDWSFEDPADDSKKDDETGDDNGDDWTFEDPTDDSKKEEDSGDSKSSDDKKSTTKESRTAEKTEEEEETSSRDEDDNLLKRGSRGDRVRQLQEKLIELAYYEGSVDGSFGPMTEEAVLKYQKDYDLAQTGTLNEAQFDALLKIEKPAEETKAEATEIPAVIEVIDPDATQAPEETPEPETAEEPAQAAPEVTVINMLKKTDAPQLGEESVYEEGIWRSSSGGTGAREVVDIEAAPVSGIVKGIRISDDGSSEKNSSVAIDAVPTEYQHIYVLSCYAKGEGTMYLQVGKNPYSSVKFDVTDEWAQYSFAFFANEEINSTEKSPVTNVFVGIVKGVASDITFCGMQLEEAQAHTWSDNND